MPTESHLPAATVLVIFGASGDLTWRKLVPALYNLSLDNLLPKKFAVVGVARSALELEAWRRHLRDGVDNFSRQGKSDPALWKLFAERLVYQSGDYSDPASFEQLAKTLAAQDKAWGAKAERVFYLATPPNVMESIVQNLGRAHLTRDRARTRVVVEKPFGRDLESARALNRPECAEKEAGE